MFSFDGLRQAQANGEVVLRRLRFLGCAWNDGGAGRVLREPQDERGLEPGGAMVFVRGIWRWVVRQGCGPFESLRANGGGRGDAMVFVRGITRWVVRQGCGPFESLRANGGAGGRNGLRAGNLAVGG